jgi:hypothetical protein
VTHGCQFHIRRQPTAAHGYEPRRQTPGAARLAPVRCARGLVHSGRGRVVAREPSHTSVYARLAALAQHEPGLLGEPEGVRLALNILRWRARGHEPRCINAAVTEGVDPVGLRQALRLASGFQQFERPYQQIQALLVPAYVRHEKFKELFGLGAAGVSDTSSERSSGRSRSTTSRRTSTHDRY